MATTPDIERRDVAARPVVTSTLGAAAMDDTGERPSEASTQTALSLAVHAAGELAAVRSTMRRWLRQELAANDTDEVLLASGEALANAIEHGQPPITISLEWSAALLLRVSVKDSGAWRVSGETNSRGLGIPIMTALMDSFTVETIDGTAIKLSRQFSS